MDIKMKGKNKAVIVGLVVVIIAAVCLCGVIGLVAILDPEPTTVIDAGETVAETAVVEEEPTGIPTKAPVKAPPTAVPVTDCQKLKTFETAITVVSGMTPNFQPTNIGVWDLAWEIEEYGGVYSIVLTEKNGCLEQAGSISVFYLDTGDPDLAGSMSGMVAGFFSDSSDGLGWLQGEMVDECPYATTQYTATRVMSDGTLWEVMCKADYAEEMMSVGMTISPK